MWAQLAKNVGSSTGAKGKTVTFLTAKQTVERDAKLREEQKQKNWKIQRDSNPLNKTMVIDAIDEIKHHLIETVADIIGEYLVPSFNAARYSEIHQENGLISYDLTGYDFPASFNFVANNANRHAWNMKTHSYKEFSINIKRDKIQNGNVIVITILFFNNPDRSNPALQVMWYYCMELTIPLCDIHAVMAINSFENFELFLRDTYFINRKFNKHAIEDSYAEDKRFELWFIWQQELKEAVRTIYHY